MEQIMQYLTPEYIFSFGVGFMAVPFFTTAIKSFYRHKAGVTKLLKWQSMLCTIIASFIIAVAWGAYAGALSLVKIPAITLAYAAFSGMLYEGWKRYILKKE